MAKSHALQRMKDGLRKILSLHTPVELSSICGCLQLKAQQKASTSLEQIMIYATETEELNEERVKKILNFMWEGALWEYLHCIGHPISSTYVDPKVTVMKLWENGGFLDGIHAFVPYFVAREVKRRNEWVQSEDIQQRLERIQKAQDSMKAAERRIISDHDYTNILQYFNQMGALRSLENDVREYLISELEIARSRIDSFEESSKISRDQLSEMEDKFVRITYVLNDKLANLEFLYEKEKEKNFHLNQYLARLGKVIDSYIDTAKERNEPGGGGAQALKIRYLDEECHSVAIKELANKLQQFRDLRDDYDSRLRERARCDVYYIHQLEENISSLQKEISILKGNFSKAIGDIERLTIQCVFTDRKLSIAENQAAISNGVAWEVASKAAATNFMYQQEHKRLKPLLFSCALSMNKQLRGVSTMIIKSLSDIIVTESDRISLKEGMAMSIEDEISKLDRIQEKERLYRMSLVAPKSAKGKSKSSTKKAPTKKPGKGDDQTVKSKQSEDGTKKQKQAAAPAKASNDPKAPKKSPTKKK
jgi:hypothetical protein